MEAEGHGRYRKEVGEMRYILLLIVLSISLGFSASQAIYPSESTIVESATTLRGNDES